MANNNKLEEQIEEILQKHNMSIGFVDRATQIKEIMALFSTQQEELIWKFQAILDSATIVEEDDGKYMGYDMNDVNEALDNLRKDGE